MDDNYRFHLMPSYYFVESTPDRVVLFNPRKEPCNFERVGDVLILGSFGKSVFKQIYPPYRVKRYWLHIGQVDYYDIYISRKSAKKMLSLINRTLTPYCQSLIRPAARNDVQGTPIHTYYH